MVQTIFGCLKKKTFFYSVSDMKSEKSSLDQADLEVRTNVFKCLEGGMVIKWIFKFLHKPD
jgi:hypothetical protein